MYCPLTAVAWTIIDSFAIPSPVPADLTAANDNEDGCFDSLGRDAVDILLRGGSQMLAG